MFASHYNQRVCIDNLFLKKAVSLKCLHSRKMSYPATLTHQHHLIATVCGLLALLLYSNSLSGDLVFDDTVAITMNSDLRPSSPWSNLLYHDFWGYKITDKSSHKSFRPICTATFKLNYLLHGLTTFGYHGVNVIINSAVCYLFVLVCGRVYEGLTLPTLLTGLLYTTHPLHTEAVRLIP